VSEALRFRGNAARWSAESALLSLTAPGLDDMELGNDAGRSLTLPAGDAAEGLGPILAMTASPQGHGIYILTPRTVLSLDRDAGLEWLYSGGTTGRAPDLPAPEPASPPEASETAPPDPQETEETDPPEEEPAETPPAPDPDPEPAGTGSGTGTGTTGNDKPDEDAAGAAAPALPFDQQPVAATPQVVREVQTALFRLGLYSGGIDGIPGPRTSAAIRLYQQRIGVAADGILTNGQLARLQQDAQEAGK
jgi:hypothetical protein